MKVKVVGNGICWVSRPNTSYIINDEMLVDTPNGSSKFMLEDVDFSKIKYILITHFHSDHFTGLQIIFNFVKNCKIPHKVKVVAPRTCFKRLMQMFTLTEEYKTKGEVLEYFEFCELKPNMRVEIGDYSIQTFKTKHNVKYCLGYVIEDDGGVKVGFTGDTAYCQGLIQLIEESQTIFIDTSSVEISDRHLSTSEVIALRKEFKDKKFYSVHVNSNVFEKYQDKLDIPNVGEIIEIK